MSTNLSYLCILVSEDTHTYALAFSPLPNKPFEQWRENTTIKSFFLKPNLNKTEDPSVQFARQGYVGLLDAIK